MQYGCHVHSYVVATRGAEARRDTMLGLGSDLK